MARLTYLHIDWRGLLFALFRLQRVSYTRNYRERGFCIRNR